MFAAALGSGSGGNSYFFESEGTRILVDAGFGPRETRKRLLALGRSIEEVQAILLTHEHSDHIHGAERIARKFGIPLYLTRGTLEASSIDQAETPIVVFENDTSFRLRDLCVHARRTIHDAADPACFVIEAGDGTRIGLATDLGFVDAEVLAHLRGCDALFFEANHDLDMLRTGSYPWSLKRRIMSRYGHLSNDDSMSAVMKLIGPELSQLCMIHLSEKNNHESIVRSMTGELMRRTGARTDVQIARQGEPSGRLSVARRRSAGAAALGQMRLF